jgi:hypothetical protein
MKFAEIVEKHYTKKPGFPRGWGLVIGRFRNGTYGVGQISRDSGIHCNTYVIFNNELADEQAARKVANEEWAAQKM